MDVQEIFHLLFDYPSDDDDDDDDIDYLPLERERHTKIPNFFETVVLTYSLTGKIVEALFYYILFGYILLYLFARISSCTNSYITKYR